MKTHIHLEMYHPQKLPAAFQDDDVRYPASLVEYFLREFTQVDDTVLDPFAGYGTTLFVAERMGRIPYGVEVSEERVRYARSNLAKPENLILGDSRSLETIELPAIDFSITSPPYMNKDDLEDPFTAYRMEGQGYPSYLRDIGDIYRQLRRIIKPTGKVVLEVANLKINGQVTTLAWDVAQEISKVMHFEGEVIVCWDKYGFGYDHSYCLLYSAV